MMGYWKKGSVALCTLSAVLISGCVTPGGDSASLVSVDDSWSIRNASTRVDDESVKLTVLLRDPISRRTNSAHRRHLLIEVERENSSEKTEMAVDLNLMQRASITNLSLDEGEITGIHVAFHNDHSVKDH